MIITSFFELFKIGPGPSSSHTIGPMKATLLFRNKIINYFNLLAPNISPQHYHLRVSLFGSLAATGHGHGTHKAVLAGLLGYSPTNINTNILSAYFEKPNQTYTIQLPQLSILFSESDIFFDYQNIPPKHPNTLTCTLLYQHQAVLEATYYSVGGGFIKVEGENPLLTPPKKLPYPYNSMLTLMKIQHDNYLCIDEILMANEMAISNLSENEVLEKINEIMQVMEQSVQQGLLQEGILPGGLNLNRRAKSMMDKAIELQKNKRYGDALFAKLNAYALATSEQNAAGQMVVTAPTNGAAGIIPAAIQYLQNDCNINKNTIQRGLLVAAMIGFIIKDNASISGAELGCQAEVGSAAAMAAALFTFCNNEPLSVIAAAAEIAMEHHLGMTCDPIKGLVQVPCIERNANGVIKAYNAYLLASGRTSTPLITFDQVVEVMRQTGLDISSKYKETALGGLATSFSGMGS